MPRKKKEETIDDIIDRIESDLETIRDKSVEDQDWEEDRKSTRLNSSH